MDAKPEQGTTLHLLTFPKPDQDPPPCDGSYTCSCVACGVERLCAVARGVRPRDQLPIRKAA